MKIEHDDKLEKNDLAEGLKSLAGKAKGGSFLNGRLIGLVVVLAAIVGVWLYLRGSGKNSDADMWKTYDGLTSAEGFEKFAEGHGNSPAARAAKLQQARFLLAQNVPQLTTTPFDAEARRKVVDAVDTARDLFAKVADEYRDDLTLRAESLSGAAAAELALVGIPKAGGGADDRGSVKKAAAFYREYAKTVGEGTPLGEQAVKKAADLEANAETVVKLGQDLNKKYSPQTAAIEEPKLPGSLTPPAATPKSPEPTAPGKIEVPSPITPSPITPPASKR